MDFGDPHFIIRRFWAANNILQNPDDMREWESLPADVVEHILCCLDKRNLANLRLVCNAWLACVNSAVSSLQLTAWPPRAAFLEHFSQLACISVSGPIMADSRPSSSDSSQASSSSSSCASSSNSTMASSSKISTPDTISMLLGHLSVLTRLQTLSITYPGSCCLQQLQLLTGLTSLAVACSGSSNSSHLALNSGSSSEDQGYGDEVPVMGYVDDNHNAMAVDLGQGSLIAAEGPGAVIASGLAAAAAGGLADVGIDSDRDNDDNAVPEMEVSSDSVEVHAPAAHGQHPQFGDSLSLVRWPAPVLPGSLSKLVNLQHLVIDNVAPEYVVLRQLPQLNRLEIRGRTARVAAGLLVACNPLPGVGCLTGLTCLMARCNYGINRVPEDIAGLTGLQHLDVSKNMLWGLPPQLLLLTQLQHLDISSNCMSALPGGISCLRGLTHLDVSNNSRITLPSSISCLTSLVSLNLSWIWSDLSPVWEGSVGLVNLKEINAVGNGLSDLPDSIGGFRALTSLALSMNNLTRLPDAIGRLTSLQSLELSDNRLAMLPASLGCLSSLVALGLRSNCLAGLPDHIGQLAALTYLDASMNHIVALPNALSCLTSLNQLALSMNPLAALPTGLSALQNLKILEMYYVRLAEEQQTPAGSEACGSSNNGSGTAALNQLQACSPGLYIFSNTLFPFDSDADAEHEGGALAADDNAATGAAGSAADDDVLAVPPVRVPELQYEAEQAAAVQMQWDLELDVASVAADADEQPNLLALLSPHSTASNITSASDNSSSSAVVSSSNSTFFAASSSSSTGLPQPLWSSSAQSTGGSYHLGGNAASAVTAVGSATSDLEGWGSGAVSDVTDMAHQPGAEDAQAATVAGKDQVIALKQTGRLRHMSAASAAAAAGNSSSSSSINWCPFPHQAAGVSGAQPWPSLATAAAAANTGALASAQLHGAWSCDLGLLHAPASAAAASHVNRASSDALIPLRPLSQTQSVGRPFLSRYSRGGEATGSPLSTYNHGLTACLLAEYQGSTVTGVSTGEEHGTAGASATDYVQAGVAAVVGQGDGAKPKACAAAVSQTVARARRRMAICGDE